MTLAMAKSVYLSMFKGPQATVFNIIRTWCVGLLWTRWMPPFLMVFTRSQRTYLILTSSKPLMVPLHLEGLQPGPRLIGIVWWAVHCLQASHEQLPMTGLPCWSSNRPLNRPNMTKATIWDVFLMWNVMVRAEQWIGQASSRPRARMFLHCNQHNAV